MKACMVSKHFQPYSGGLEVRVLELARWLADRGEDVLVLTSHEQGTADVEDMHGFRVLRSRAWFSLSNALFTPGILLDLLKSDYDFIDVNLPDPVNSIFAFVASLLRGKPLFVTYHADIVRGGLMNVVFKLFYNPIQYLVLKRARRIFATSPNYAESSPAVSRFMDKVVVAPSFISPERFNTGVDALVLRRSLAASDEKLVLFVGRLVPYKGVDVLLEAFSKILGHVTARLIIIGSGELDGELKAKASNLGLEDHVNFRSEVGDGLLPKYYMACDLLVLPSVTRQEAFGLVLVEAMACGKPVISSDFSGMPYVVGDAGLLVEPGNPERLANAILRILSDDSYAENLGSKAVKRVGELFTRDVVCERILEVYKSGVVKDKDDFKEQGAG
ncbi:MAG: glycosyltransferase [Candidatus Altiarchaeales archaeon]|nr:glycosyltransferase [Candidatus Altiarchaeales archaeon]MBD3415627.1 glycosyltransferase [Candidatus Altiarchaeales archaeon]